ncbi:MAG: energy transducer TonB [bacterium]
MASKELRGKNPSKDLKIQYRKIFELSLIISLVLMIVVLQGFKTFEGKEEVVEKKLSHLDIEEVPQTEQQKSAAPPSRPTVPIPSEDETLPEDETIDDTMLDMSDEAPPPPPPPDDQSVQVKFIPHDEPPEPVGGYSAIQRNLTYPEIALKAGVEGQVLVWAFVDKAGNVTNTQVKKSLGNNGCDEAAVKAIKSVKWKPAKQRDDPVGVWVMVPVEFKLR